MKERIESGSASPDRLEKMLSQPGMPRRDFLATLSAGVAGTLLMMCEGTAFAQSGVKSPEKLGQGTPLDAYLALEEPFFTAFARTLLLDPTSKYFVAGQK